MRFLSEAGDATAATRLAPNDWYRAERALEVVTSTGKPITDFGPPKKHARGEDADEAESYEFVCVALSSPRVRLYRRIDARVEEMVRDGMLAESAEMLLAGIAPGSTPASRAIGYRQTMAFLDRMARRAQPPTTSGAVECDHAAFTAYLEETQRATRAFAKRQFTWFRGEKEGRFWWLDVSRAEETPEDLTRAVLDLFALGPPRELSRGEDQDETRRGEAAFSSAHSSSSSARRWDAEASARLFALTDDTRGATDHEPARELKRYAPRQTVFVDAAASRGARREVEAWVEKIRRIQ